GWAAIIAVPTLITGYFGMNVPYPGFGEKAGFAASIVTIILTGWCSTSSSNARTGCKTEDREAGQFAVIHGPRRAEPGTYCHRHFFCWLGWSMSRLCSSVVSRWISRVNSVL